MLGFWLIKVGKNLPGKKSKDTKLFTPSAGDSPFLVFLPEEFFEFFCEGQDMWRDCVGIRIAPQHLHFFISEHFFAHGTPPVLINNFSESSALISWGFQTSVSKNHPLFSQKHLTNQSKNAALRALDYEVYFLIGGDF